MTGDPDDTSRQKDSPVESDQLQRSAFVAKCMADENRLRILLSLVDGQKSVSVIVEELGLSQPLVSHHLRELKRALLVNVQRNGPFVFYRLADPRITNIIGQLDRLARELIERRTRF